MIIFPEGRRGDMDNKGEISVSALFGGGSMLIYVLDRTFDPEIKIRNI